MGIYNFFYKWGLRVLTPEAAKKMEQDGALNMPILDSKTFAEEDYVYIDDKGAEITVFAYSGIDALFAGEPRFEFRKVFGATETKCNLVCFRDLRKMLFHLAPDGSMEGLRFYTDKTREIMARLGARYNVAIGSSSGGQAAFYIGTKCRMDKIVAFSPAFPHSVYNAPRNILKTLLNVGMLFREREAYIEAAIVTLAAVWVERSLRKKAKGDRSWKWDTLKVYCDAGDSRPVATVFYGERCGPDARQARIMAQFPQVTLIPVKTARHNTPAVLKKQRQLAHALAAELRFAAANPDECEVLDRGSEENV